MGTNGAKYGIPAIIGTIAVCLVCICCSAIGLYYYGDSIFGTGPAITPNVSTDPIVPADTSGLPEWTIMVYSAADDDILEQDMWFDINEMEMVGSTDQMNIIVQIDRAEGAFTGDGDWTDARRLYITQDDDLNHLNSQIVQNLGEVDMGSPQTLVDFATWTIQNYPAKKYALIMSDHGGGWTGGFSDLSSGENLSMSEISDSIAQVQQSMGGQKFEIIGFDACLMGMVEVYGALYEYSNYMIASEEVIPSSGWSYSAWLYQLAQNPAMGGREASQSAVSTYIVEDMALNLSYSPSDISEIELDTTLSAIDSARMPDVISAMNQFITTIANIDQGYVAEARQYTRSYYSLFGEDVPSTFIDLGNFAELAAYQSGDAAVQQASDQLRTAIASAVVAEKHGGKMAGSYGISFHFPISDIYVLTEYTDETSVRYRDDAYKFLQQSSWDEFLAFHYTGQAFVPQEGQAFVPDQQAEIVAPGASELSIAPIQLSDTAISGDEILTMNTTVTGNASYIYFILYFYNEEAGAYWVGDTSYVFSENTIAVDGVNAPDYGPSPIQVTYEWEPNLFVLMDGQTEAFALFEPDEYLSSEGVSTYSVYGQYTVVGGSPDDAKLVFDPDGNLLNIYALPDADGDGISTPSEITPQIGDQFTDYVQSYYFDENNEPYFDYSLSTDVFTYGEQGFWFEARYPVDGDYAIGFYAQDFDNNTVEAYEFITYQAE